MKLKKHLIVPVAASAFFAIFILVNMLSHSTASANVVYPRSLNPGDKIAILAPAGPVDSLLVDSAALVISQIGYEPVVYPTAHGKYGYFSAPHSERLADLKAALTDSTVRAILCARGGYGAAILLDSLATLPIADDPKWIIGFSDISALHGLMASKNVASIHSSMAKHIALGPDDQDNAALFDILKGNFPVYTVATDTLSHQGRAEGMLLGGNLAVIQALIETPYNIIKPNTILFIEDVSEPIYKVQRMIYQLRMAGVFNNIKGLIVGQFTEYNPDGIYEDMNVMIADALADYPDLPVAFNFPVGHVDHNVPLVEGAHTILEITPDQTTLTQR